MSIVGGAISGILRDRQREIGGRAEQHDQDRQDRREDRPVDAEMREAHRCASVAAPPPASGSISPGCGVTLAPGRARTRPLMMIFSLPCQAFADDPRDLRAAMARGGSACGTTVPSSVTVMTMLFDWSVRMALSGTRIASYSFEPGKRRRPNWPGVMNRSGFGRHRRGRGSCRSRDRSGCRRSSSCRDAASHVRRAAASATIVSWSRVEGTAPRLHGALIGEEIAFAHVEGEVDRVERHDRWSAAWRFGSPVTRLPTSIRRLETRPEIGAVTLVKSRLSCSACSAALALLYGSLRDVPVLHPLVERGGRLGGRLHQRLCPTRAGCPPMRAGIGGIEIGLGAVDGGLIGSRIDDEEHVALLHDRAIREVDRLQIARDAGANLDRGRRFEAAGELVPFREALMQRRRHGDRRWRRIGWLRSSRVVAGGQKRGGSQTARPLTRRRSQTTARARVLISLREKDLLPRNPAATIIPTLRR